MQISNQNFAQIDSKYEIETHFSTISDWIDVQKENSGKAYGRKWQHRNKVSESSDFCFEKIPAKIANCQEQIVSISWLVRFVSSDKKSQRLYTIILEKLHQVKFWITFRRYILEKRIWKEKRLGSAPLIWICRFFAGYPCDVSRIHMETSKNHSCFYIPWVYHTFKVLPYSLLKFML